MAHHQIYIPREFEGDRGRSHPLANVGLADHVAGAECIPSNGPDGGQGTLCAWRNNTTNRRLHYNGDEQVWFPAVPYGDAPAGRYWVGVWNDAPPAEAELRKPGILFGQDVSLNAGTWHVPAPTFLPHDLVLNERGDVERSPKQDYQEITLEAKRWHARLIGDPQTIDEGEWFNWSYKCLSLNYKLPRELMSHLKLIDEENVRLVLYATMGFDLSRLNDGEQ